MVNPFPLYLPPGAPRLFETEVLLRRLARMTGWGEASQLLEIGATPGGLALAHALGCRLTVIEPDAQVAAELEARGSALGVRAQWVRAGLLEAPRPQGLDGLFTLSRVLGPPRLLAATYRPSLGLGGRLGLLCVVRVGRSPGSQAQVAWERRLGAPLPSPSEVMQSVEAEGFEPELMEVASAGELDASYGELEALLARPGAPVGEGPDALRAEIGVHRAQGTRLDVSMAFFVARRKEPGEKPPLSRDAG